MPRVYSALVRTLRDERASAKDVAGILEQDMAMCAKLLQLVNSAFFRIANRITSIEQAVAYLGFNMVKNLVLSVEVFEAGRTSLRVGGLSIAELQSHALATASLATRMVEDRAQAEDAFMAGMLHDIGKLVLAMELPEHMTKILAESRQQGVPLHVVEQRLSGVTHAEVGGYLLGLWGLPYPVVEAVANHHAPMRVPQRGFDVLSAVHVADAFVLNPADARCGDGEAWHALIEPSYFEELGVESRVDSWKRTAEEVAREQADE